MFGLLLPLVYRNYELFDESNKENVGYVVRRRVRVDITASTSAAPNAIGGGQSVRNVSAVGPSKVASRRTKQLSDKRPAKTKSGKKQSKKPRDGDKKTLVVSKAVGKKRRPLEDITHLFAHERAQAPATRASTHLSTSAAMRFF